MAHRVISADTAAVKPAAPSGDQEWFTDAGAGTLMPAAWCNSVQDEICTVVEAGGLTPDPADDTQLWQVLEPSVSLVGGAGNLETPAALTNAWRRAVIASATSIAGRADVGALSCLVAASDNSWAREARSLVGASIGVQVNGKTSSALAVIGVSSGTPQDVIESTAEGSAIIACELNSRLMADSRSCFAAGSRDVELHADRASVLACDDVDVYAGTSAAIASQFGRVGNTSASTLNAMLATQGVDNANPARIGVTADVECSSMLATQDSATRSEIDSDSCAIIASGDVKIYTGSPRSAAIATGGGEITGQESVLMAGNANTIDSGADRSTVIGGNANVCSMSNSHIIGCDESYIPTLTNDGTVMLASYRVSAGFSAAATDYQVMGGVNVGSGTPKWRIDSTEGRFRGTLAATTGGLDYAEYFENADGVEHGPGRMLARKGRSVTLGQPGLRAMGIVSTTPSFIGGDDAHGWARQHETDEWGRPIYETVKLDNGRTITALKRHPDYDPERAREHRPRSSRPDEWTLVALVGQVRVAVYADVKPDDFLECGVDGLGKASDRETRFEVMDIEKPFDVASGYAIAVVLVR